MKMGTATRNSEIQSIDEMIINEEAYIGCSPFTSLFWPELSRGHEDEPLSAVPQVQTPMRGKTATIGFIFVRVKGILKQNN